MRKICLFFVVVGLTGSFRTSSAADRFWDLDAAAGLQAGNGTWDTGTTPLWATTVGGTTLTVWNDDDGALFQTGGVNGVTLSGTILANRVQQTTNGTNTTLTGGTLQLQSDLGVVNSGNLALTINSAVTLNSANVRFGTSSAGNIVVASAIGELGGARGLNVEAVAGTLTFSGGAANTYTGLTTINGNGTTGGVLALSKSTGVTAVAGDITISNAGRLQLTASNQIADTSNVVMSGAGSVFNGTSVNGGQGQVTETIASLTVTGGVVNSGSNATGIIVTNAASFTGGSGNTIYVGNSGSRFTAGSLSLTNMTGTAGAAVGTVNTFTVYGNSTGQMSLLTVGSGGLTLDNSVLNLRRGGASALGSRLVLGGDVSAVGTSLSRISEDTNGGTTGTTGIDLSNVTGSFNRTISVDATAGLTISVPIFNGSATTGAITKAAAGTLTMSAASTFNGGVTIDGGRLLANNTTGSATGTGAVDVNTGGTLGGTGFVSGLVTVDGGGTLLGGSGAATNDLSLSGGVFLDSGSTIQLALGAAGAHSSLTRTAGVWTFDATQDFSFLDLGAELGFYDNIIVGLGVDPGTTSGWQITNPGWVGTFAYDGANIDLTLTAVPEPSTSLLLSGAALALLFHRFRRKQLADRR